MYGVIQTAGAKQLPSQAYSIVPIVAARCMSTAPTMASGFLNIPVPIIPKFRVGHYTMLNEFVEKILVHERSRKGSQDTTQEIEIYFNFLGRYIPPSLQPVPLTPEEQEELRKREERKDRLHQNYLKRKASGAQKRYEDKIKAKKKAEMDAKKALIRAEDMKKGVFSTIGQLPKEEPRKGSIAASAAV